LKKIDLGQTTTILANIGVIAGIVFLGYELRQNNELMGAEQRFNRLSVATGSATLIADNAALAAVLTKANEKPDELTTTEQLQIFGFTLRILRNMEWSFNELPRDTLAVNEWRGLSRLGYWQYGWNDLGIRNMLDPEFVGWMEDNIIEPRTE